MVLSKIVQVFNICIECKMSTEALHEKQMQQYIQEDNGIHGDAMNDSESEKQSSDDDEFFDPEEEEVLFDSPSKAIASHQIEDMLKIRAMALNPSHNRVGARCPVPDAMPLIRTGDQLYAPYLQRTLPMTDEEEENHKKLMGGSKAGKYHDQVSIQSRIAISQRLQKPKLLSDMSSFKAANPTAIFEDFVLWYGNPENPLNEEINGETARRAFESRSTLPPDQAKVIALEEASEAIREYRRDDKMPFVCNSNLLYLIFILLSTLTVCTCAEILMSLRAFWEDTWENATPCPAFEQEPLFDPYSSVEMVLHSFETIHPALLMNQALAVNLASAKFVLDTASQPARKVRSVDQAMLRLKSAIDAALEMLTKDAEQGFLHLAPNKTTDDSDPLVYVSTLTITKCEEACNIVG